MSLLLEMFTYPFILRAFAVGILVSLCAALLGVPLVLKRYSMIGDGLSHVSFGALAFAPLVLSAVRFRDHLLKDEGYLTLTLPVNMHQLLASKLIVSAVWYAAAFLAVVLLCMIGAFDFSDWRVVPQFAADFLRAFRKLDSSMQGQALLFALEFFLFCVLGVTAVSLIVYAAYAVGFSFNKHKSALTAVSVLVFFQLVQFAAIAVLANLFCDGFTAWSSLTGVQAGNAIFAVALVCELIVCVIFYLVTYFFLTRKLNLE